MLYVDTVTTMLFILGKSSQLKMSQHIISVWLVRFLHIRKPTCYAYIEQIALLAVAQRQSGTGPAK